MFNPNAYIKYCALNLLIGISIQGDPTTPGFQAGGFIRSRPDLEHPDLQFVLIPPAFEKNPIGLHANSIKVSCFYTTF